MKKPFGSLALLLPLAGLGLLISGMFESNQDQASTVHPQSRPDVVAAARQSAAEVPAPVALPLPPAGVLWTFDAGVAGDPDGLSDGLAALSRGQSILPSGRRQKIKTFPNLRVLREGEKVNVGLPDGRSFEGRVNWSRRDEGYENTHQASIGFIGDKGGLVAIHDGVTGRTQGRLLVEGDRLGWTLEPENDGTLWLVEHLRADMVCELPTPVAAARASVLPGDPLVTGSGTVAPNLNSRDSATATLYIDFDGEPTRIYPDWPCGNPATPIPVPHSGLTADQMTRVWRRVAEDFIPFNINVSTELAKYNAAPVGRRMRILVAGTLPTEPPSCVGGAGLAFLRSFQLNSTSGYSFSSRVPCWLAVSPNYGNPATMTDAEFSSMASNITHEFGHTLHLFHDGNDGVQPTLAADGNYYPGHGTAPFDWSPIMGSPYRTGSTARTILQWAKNDYPGANNSQDDLAVITGPDNGFGYTGDENAGHITANILNATEKSNQVDGVGVTMNPTDYDWWLFTVRVGGNTTIEVAPADTSVSLPNLDCAFRVENELGNPIAGEVSSQDNLEAKTTLNLAPGTYYVVTYGMGNRTFSTGGYGDYGSIGRYIVTVDLPADVQYPVPVILSPSTGVLTSPSLEFHGTATDNDRVSGLSVFLRRNSDNAYWNGTYWQIETWGLARDHNPTTGAWTCTATLPQVGGSGPGSLNAGSYDFIAIAEDPAGHSKQVDVRVTVDSAGPAVTVGSPAVTLSASGYPFSGTAQDSNGVQAVNCFIRRNSDGQYWNGSGWGVPAINLPTNHVSTNSPSQHSWICTAPSLPQPGAALGQGSYTFIAIAEDPLGNNTQADSVVLIDDNQAPQVAVTMPAHNSFVSALSSIGGTATDMSGIKDGKVTLTLYQVSTGKFWSGSAWSDSLTALHGTVNGSAWSYGSVPAGGNLSAGEYLISSNARDNAGTLSEPVSGVNQTSFRVDLDPPTVSITTPQDGAVISALPAVSGTAQDTNGISAVRLYLYRFADGKFWDGGSWGGGGSAILATQVSGTSWVSLPAANLPQPGSNPSYNLTNGSYDIIAFAVDTAGNQTRADAVVSVQLTYTWTGGTLRDLNPNNNTNSWDAADNWSPAGVPGSEDIVVLPLTDRVDTSVSRTVRGMRMSDGMLNFTSGAGPNGTLTTTEASTWTGGAMTGIWANQSTITVGGAAVKLLWDNAVLNNYGTVIWEGGGTIQAQANNGTAVINNKSGGTFRIAADSAVFSRNLPYFRPVFNNENGAVLEKQSSGGFSTLTVWEFHNAGEIRCGTGTLAFVDNWMDNYDLFLDPGTTLTGAGYLRINNATQLNTAVHAQCAVEMMDGSQIAAPAVANVARFEGTLNWWGGVIVGNLTIGPAGVVNLSDVVAATPKPKVLWDSTTLNNQGVINWLGGGTLQAQANNGTATINNLSGGIFNVTADGPLFSRANPYFIPVFNHESGALFRKTAGTGTTLINTFSFNHRGGMVCDTGVLAFNTVLNIASTTPWTGAGAYEMQGGTTTVSGAMSLNGPPLSILAGSVYGAPDGSGAFATAGTSTVEWKGGTIVRTLSVTAGSTMNLSGPAVKLLWDDAVLNNDGTITWQGGGPLRAQANNGPATVNNRSGARFDAGADGTVFDRANPYFTPVFNNLAGATFVRSLGSGAATIQTYTFNNQGEIAAETGVLAFNTTLNLKAGGTLLGPGRFEVTGGTTNFTGVSALTGTSFTVLAGTITGASGAVVASSSGGAWRWLGGNLSGTLEIGANSEFQIGDPPAGATVKLLQDGAVLNNKGLVSWSGSGAVQGQAYSATSTVNNRAGGRFTIISDGSLLSRLNTYFLPVFNNEAGSVFEKPAGNPAIASTCDWSFKNAGTVHIGAGKVDLLQGGDSSGTFTADAGAYVRFRGGSHTLRNGAILSGTGLIQVDGGTVLGDGILNGNTTGAGAFEVLSGTLGGTTNYTGAGLLHWAGGTVAGTLTLTAGTRAELDGAPVKLLWDGAMINIYGTMIWHGGGTIRAQGDIARSTINNKSGGIFRMAADGTVFDRNATYQRPIFNNENGAVFEKQNSGGFSTLTIWEYHNAGEIRCGTGTLAFVDGGFDNYDLFLDPGTTLTGAGSLRINNATQLNTAVHALCAVELMDASQIAAPAVANVARFEGTLNWWGGVIVGNLTIGPAGTVNLSDVVAATPKPKVLWDSTTLNNQGVINWLGGGTLQALANSGTATINNLSGGIFNVTADGPLFSRANPYFIPVFNHESGAIFRKTAGTGTTLINTFSFNHRGGMVCDTGVLAFNTVLNIASITPWTGAGAYEMQGGTTTVSGAMSLNGPPFSILAGSLYGALDGSGAFATAGTSTVEWKGGTFLRTLSVTAGSTLNLSGPEVKLLWDDAVLNNDGTITWQGGGPLRAQANSGPATVNNRSGARFDAAADGTVFDRANPYFTPVFNNAGSFSIGASPGSCGMSVWRFTQSATGALNIEIAGPALTEFDRLTLTGGSLTLGGALNVTKLNGYAPAEGVTFAFLNSPGRTGNFGTVNAPGFAVDYTPGGATLRAVAAGLPFDAWAASNGLTGANALPNADPDGDGQTNFAEYVFNTSPVAGSPAPQTTGTVTIGGQQWLTVNYRRWADREAAGVTYAPQAGGSLGGWSSTGIIDEADPGAPVIPGSTACRCRILIAGPVNFLRVKAEKQ